MKTIISLFLCILTISTALAQKSAYRFEVNKPYRYRSVGVSDVNVEFGPQKQKMRANDSSISNITFIEYYDNGDGKFTYTLEYGVMTGDAAATAEGNKIFAALVGKTLTFRINRFGDIIEKDTALVTLPPNSASKLIQMLKVIPHIDPENLEDNKSWDWETSDTLIVQGAPLSSRTKSVYTPAGTADIQGVECARIDAITTLEMEGEMTANNIDISMSGSGTTNASTYFDANAGIIRRAEFTTTSDINMLLPSMPEYSGVIKVDTKSNSELLP